MDFESCMKELGKHCEPCNFEEFNTFVEHYVNLSTEKGDVLWISARQYENSYIMAYFLRSYSSIKPILNGKLKIVPSAGDFFRIGHINIDVTSNQASYFLNIIVKPVLISIREKGK